MRAGITNNLFGNIIVSTTLFSEGWGFGWLKPKDRQNYSSTWWIFAIGEFSISKLPTKSRQNFDLVNDRFFVFHVNSIRESSRIFANPIFSHFAITSRIKSFFSNTRIVIFNIPKKSLDKTCKIKLCPDDLLIEFRMNSMNIIPR